MSGVVIFISRTVSAVAAFAVTATVIIFPRLIATDMHTVPHGQLVVLMLGMSAAYVHAFGFTPENRWLKWIFSPVVAWPLLLLGSWGVFY